MSDEPLLSTADNYNALNAGDRGRIKKISSINAHTGLNIELPDGAGAVPVTGIDIDIACELEVSNLGWRVS
jgi:hypothetical protein